MKEKLIELYWQLVYFIKDQIEYVQALKDDNMVAYTTSGLESTTLPCKHCGRKSLIKVTRKWLIFKKREYWVGCQICSGGINVHTVTFNCRHYE